MSDEKKPGSASKLSKILQGSFTNAHEREKFITVRQTLLNDAGISYLFGYISEAGPLNDGTFNVEFISGTAGYATLWPQWAYEPARDALLYGKQVLVAYTGAAPYGSTLTGVFI